MLPAGVRLREMNRSDMAGILALERDLFPEDAWTPDMFAAELTQSALRLVVPGG